MISADPASDQTASSHLQLWWNSTEGRNPPSQRRWYGAPFRCLSGTHGSDKKSAKNPQESEKSTFKRTILHDDVQSIYIYYILCIICLSQHTIHCELHMFACLLLALREFASPCRSPKAAPTRKTLRWGWTKRMLHADTAWLPQWTGGQYPPHLLWRGRHSQRWRHPASKWPVNSKHIKKS